MARNIYLVEERPCATTDFFLRPMVVPAIATPTAGQTAAAQRCGFNETPSLRALIGTEVILVRYLPSAWLRALSHPDLRLQRLVLFIDDDLLDPIAWAGLPWRYRWKLFWLCTRRWGWLARRLRRGQAELWVGSEALQRKYAKYRPKLIRPRPLEPIQPSPTQLELIRSQPIRAALIPPKPIPMQAISLGPIRPEAPESPVPKRSLIPQGSIQQSTLSQVASSRVQQRSRAPASTSTSITPMIRLFYHGSASHQREHAWVQQLMRTLLKADARIELEVIADQRIAKGYRGLPRTWVVPPMDWSRYRAFIQQPGRHIGLAPLLPSAFNAARSYTKFFDITAAAAVGLYPRGTVYEEMVEHEQDGLLLPIDLEQWTAVIRELAANPTRRASLVSNATHKVNAQRDT